MSDLDDPEDAYDATDPPRVRLVNIVRRVVYVAGRLEVLYPNPELIARLDRIGADVARLADQVDP